MFILYLWFTLYALAYRDEKGETDTMLGRPYSFEGLDLVR